MADVTIPGLTTQLTSVDRAADLLEVSDTSDSGNSKKSSVNNLLDLTSHPVGIDDVQTITNKTITAPTVSSPVLSGTVTGTYTLGGTPTFPSAVVTLTGSQTLTNKVLTSPTINAPTITNPTITVDTISEFTATNGVTIDGLNIKDSALNTANSVPNSALSNTGVFGSAWAQQSWTPTLTNFTLGNGTKSGSYVQMGKMVFAEVYVACGSTTAFGTDMFIELPMDGASKYSSRSYSVVGKCALHDAGAKIWDGVLYLTSDVNSAQVRYLSTSAAPSITTPTAPFTIANGDTLQFSLIYEAA